MVQTCVVVYRVKMKSRQCSLASGIDCTRKRDAALKSSMDVNSGSPLYQQVALLQLLEDIQIGNTFIPSCSRRVGWGKEPPRGNLKSNTAIQDTAVRYR